MITYGHELANLFDYRLNPKGKNGKKPGYVYNEHSIPKQTSQGTWIPARAMQDCMAKKGYRPLMGDYHESNEVYSLFGIATCLLLSTNSFCLAQAKKWSADHRKAGPLFDLSPTITVEEANAQKGVVRALLWDLWKSRTRGGFHVRSYSIEGQPTNCQYLVKPREGAQWQVVLKCQGSICPFTSAARCRQYLKSNVASYDLVVRRGVGSKDHGSTIPDDQARSPLQFILVLTNLASGATQEL